MIRVERLSLDLQSFRLEDVSFTAPKASYTVILGPSGAGKTLVLECIAGLRKPDRGRIIVDGEDVTNKPPEKRGLAFVPQNYALWPHMTVHDNIAYPLRCRGLPQQEVQRRVHWIAEELGITHLLNRKPPTLSGGEQQRVALARALVWEPRALLLDEPTAALDPSLRATAWRLLRRIHQHLKLTIIHVTHDIAEAAALATHAVFMDKGRVAAEGSLDQVLATPQAAAYLGDTNLLQGTVEEAREDLAVVNVAGARLYTAASLKPGTRVLLLLRPEDIVVTTTRLEEDKASTRNHLEAKVLELEPRGPITLLHTETTEGLKLRAYITRSAAEHLGIKPGAKIHLYFKATALKPLPKP